LENDFRQFCPEPCRGLSERRQARADQNQELASRPVQVRDSELPVDAPIQIRAMEESGQTWLEFKSKEIFPTKGKPNNQVPWSGKIQISLRDGLVEERVWVKVIKKE